MNKAELRKLAEAAVCAAPITKVETGATALKLSDREWNRLNQNYIGGKAVNETIEERITQRDVVVDHMGRERVRNGLGEWVA